MLYWHHHGGGGLGWIAASVGLILFWALVVTVGILVFRALARPGRHGGEPPGWHMGPQPTAGPTAEQILAERYARGEIEDEEYQRRLAMLRASKQGPAPP
ncbi:hypothetical protein GCM10010211_43940 [Streptomyces albospinus]|uniref:SHOCT domain-containing protein n=1 Tax=Streptomyces albospinus TaxID=285515 RepID=A0ABQ2VAD8_9ACTN|nr:SHOCT domain-containing protein [Streptomyces albospinus]GGU73289.1 hypothetical protein GCM10010211_43940 [Streptomyces albospinus]